MKILFDILIKGGVIVTMDERMSVLRGHYIGIKAGRISEVGTAESMKDCAAETVIDASGKAVLPGLIDCHCHAGHSFTRGESGGGWEVMAEDRYYRCSTPDFWYAEARLAAAEKITFGTTTSVNMIGNTPRIDDEDIVDAHFAGAESMGVRIISGIGSPNPPWPKNARKWHGENFSEYLVNPKDAYAITERVIRKHNNTNRGRSFSYVLPSRIGHTNPNAHELSIEQMNEMRRIADECGVRIHGHSYRGDIAFTAEHCPRCLGEDVFIAHCTGITDEEVRIIADTGTTVVTGPSTVSHINNRCPVTEILELGGKVVVATDGNAPDRTFDLWKDIRIAQLLHRNFHHDASLLPAEKVLRMVTADAARALGLEKNIGSVEVGKCADVIMVNIEQPHLYPFFNPVEQLVNAASGQDVDTVLIDGEIIMLGRRIVKADIKTILSDAEREFENARKRAGAK